jgi:hypothetical protein
MFQRAEMSPACAGKAIPVAVAAKLNKAENLITEAAAGPAKMARKLLKRAKKVLKQEEVLLANAAKGRNPKLSPDCAKVIKDAAHGVLAGLGV